MVPEGLVLLTSIAFAVAVVRLARRRVLVQELPAVEGLARVDVLCIDKTGTLTEGKLTRRPGRAARRRRSIPSRSLARARGRRPRTQRHAAARSATGSRRADGWIVEDAVPFSSARKWSGASFVGRGHRGCSARPTCCSATPARRLANGRRRDARRRVAGRAARPFGRARRRCAARRPKRPLRWSCWPIACARTPPTRSGYFAEQGVTVKVLCGDDPATVGAIASSARSRGRGGAGRRPRAARRPRRRSPTRSRRTRSSGASRRSRSGRWSARSRPRATPWP